jgi:periplasmic protein CpxP/Spy
MNRIFKALGVALALGISISAAVAADAHREGGGRGGFRALNLTDTQKDQMKALHKGERDQMGAQMKDLRDAHQALRAQVFADNPDNAQIESLKTKIAGLESAMLSARVDMDRKVAAILTPEQRKTMATLPPRPFGRHGGRHHGPHGGGDDAPHPDGDGPAQQ